MMHHSATYSPEDDKIRIYPGYRLDKETEYAEVKAAGYQWAPKQGCFYAVWSPVREDLAIKMAGEIDDEAISLEERAEQRAARFEGYEANRRRDSEAAQRAVSAIADGIPLGQPILVGHHSEKRARKDAERIETGMRRAVKMWDTAEYWVHRAAGALAHARYKERPGVRARRIKTLEAEQRKFQRGRAADVKLLATWESAHDDETSTIRRRDGSAVTFKERAIYIANHSHRHELYTALEAGTMTPETAQAGQIERLRDHHIARADRWIAHLEHRIGYERALLEEAGESHRLEKPKRRELAPLLNYRAPEGLTIPNRWNRGELVHYPQIEKTRAEYAAIHDDYKATRIVDGSHRVRTVMERHSLFCVFITDAGTHPRPAPPAPPEPTPEPEPAGIDPAPHSDPIVSGPEPEPEPAPDVEPEPVDAIAAMRESLRHGIKITSAPQLFPTPPPLADEMIERADIRAGMLILEPQAGTGRLLDALIRQNFTGAIVAVEHSLSLVDQLRRRYEDGPGITYGIVGGDFLKYTPEQLGTFDRIVSNPPFGKGADVDHINHARRFLRPGGILVALCANGQKQQAAFRDVAHEYLELPDGSFASEGTGVRVALVVFHADPIAEVAIETANAIARSGEASDAPFALKSETAPRPSTQIGLFE